MVQKTDYDVLIVGGGCGGYPAGMYASRFNLKVGIITKLRGGLITTTHLVENYPGFISLTGSELAKKLEDHALHYGAEILDDQVDKIEKKGNVFYLKLAFSNKELSAKSIILATGTKHKHLGVKGEEEFKGKGVSYCATCDGGFFKEKVVGIVGGSDSAAKEAMVLAMHSKKVYMLIRSHLKAEPINIERIRKNPKIEIIEGVNVKEIKGENIMKSVLLDKEINGSFELNLDGVFIAIGMNPQNELAKQLDVALNEKGEIIIDRLSRTNVEGVFAAGDVTNAPWKQGIVAAAEGSIAAYSAFEYIQKVFK
jgi:thioredoxin-disulfide reductase